MSTSISVSDFLIRFAISSNVPHAVRRTRNTEVSLKQLLDFRLEYLSGSKPLKSVDDLPTLIDDERCWNTFDSTVSH